MAVVASTLGGFDDTSKIPPSTAFMTDSELVDYELLHGKITPKKGKFSTLNIVMIIMFIMGLFGAFGAFFLYKFFNAVKSA